MPVRERAGGRVKIHTDEQGVINKLIGKGISGSALPTFQGIQDMYEDYGPRQLGEDPLGRANRHAIMRDGYIFDVDTVEAYAQALLEFAQQQRRRNAEYHETHNTAPAAR